MKEAYHLPDNYLVISFYQQNWPQQEWADRFMEEAHKHGYTCVGVPMPQDGRNSLFDVNVELPIDPLQWYALIKYSGGYIGNNMHPVIVALHNAIPFFSYNIHGESLLRNRIQLLWTSKEYDLLKRFHLQQYLAPQPMLNLISPKKVVQKMVHFDRTHALTVSKQLEGEYVQMMEQICSRFI